MAGTIKISSDLDARGFLKGTSNMEEALEDVSKDLKDTSKDGDKALENLEKSFADAAKAAKDSGNDMRRGIGDGAKQGAKQAGEASEEIKNEFKSNLSEVTSSFDGSIESVGDLVQGTLGGLVGGLGALGGAVGAAAAVGVGVAISSITQAEEEAKQATVRIGELANAMIDAGTNGEIPLEIINENLRDIVTNSEDAIKKFEDIARASKFVGTQAENMALAYAGNEEAIKSQLKVMDDLLEAAEKETELMSENASRAGASSQAKVQSLQAQRDELQKIQEETQRAAEIEEAYLAAGGAEMEAKAAAIGTINSAYDDAAGSILDFKDQETGVLDVQAYLDSMAQRTQALADYQTALAESGFSTEQKAALNEMGIEASAAWMEGYKNASPAQQAEMERILSEMASESSGQAVKEMEKAFEKPVEAKVEAKVDMKMAQQDLDNLIKARTAVIKLDFRDRNGKPVD